MQVLTYREKNIRMRDMPEWLLRETYIMDGYHLFYGLHTSCKLTHISYPTEGYPSGLRGWFAKSLVRRDLEREFESPLLRQIKTTTLWSLFLFNEVGRDSHSRVICGSRLAGCSAKRMKRKSVYIFSRMNGGAIFDCAISPPPP